MAKRKASPRGWKVFMTTNVGANESKRTLWLFGAGASVHLGFPISSGFFARSIRLCAQHFKTFPRKVDPGFMFFSNLVSGRGLPVPTLKTIRSIKTEPSVALEHIAIWDCLQPDDSGTFVKIQALFNAWRTLTNGLRAVGLTMSPDEILESNPEDLIDRIRKLSPRSLLARGDAHDLAHAKSIVGDVIKQVQTIYFITLSMINDEARQGITSGSLDSHYLRLVRSLILEKNARVLTFNYDTMLDEALFSSFTQSWKYGGMAVYGFNGYRVAVGGDADLVVIKPHGSLNYLVCQNCGRAHVHWHWSYRETGAGTGAQENRRCVSCRKAMPGRKELLRSLTVAPLYDKRIIKRSHHAIRSAVSWADVIVAIGYSFPGQDDYFYRHIASGVRKRKGRRLDIKIISHTAKSAGSIKRRLRKQLASHRVSGKHVHLHALPLNGFEEVRSGPITVPA